MKPKAGSDDPDLGAGVIGRSQRGDEREGVSCAFEIIDERISDQAYRSAWHTACAQSGSLRRSGSFLLDEAIAQGAQIFVTGDFKYHQFFDADGKVVIADIGHFESEQFTVDLICDLIRDKFPNFAPNSSERAVNPVRYYI